MCVYLILLLNQRFSSCNGYVHEDTKAFFKFIANKCSQNNKIPNETMYIYFMKCISIRLQNSMAKAINMKNRLLITMDDHNDIFNDRLIFNEYQDDHEHYNPPI